MNYYERVCAEINLSNLENNIREIKRIICDGTKLMAVVKADAYGHGAVKIAESALEYGADILGVAVMEEAIELRKAGINAPIIILGASFRPRIADIIDYDCCQTVFSIEMAEDIQAIAKAMRRVAKIQVKIDTGMGRLGFLPSEKAVDEICRIFEMKNITVEAICSHFSCADRKDKAYTKMQNQQFSTVINALKQKGINIPQLHISNSAGVLDMQEMNYDAVRTGIIMYGLFPSSEVNKGAVNIKPLMSLKSTITFIKTLPKDQYISYNAAYKTERETVVATIPVGYADGYLKRNGKDGYVLINGEYAPVIGDICMDQFMADVTEIPNVCIGDEVVILGSQGDKEITAYDLAKNCGTIVHEITCGISKRVPRIYVRSC